MLKFSANLLCIGAKSFLCPMWKNPLLYRGFCVSFTVPVKVCVLFLVLLCHEGKRVPISDTKVKFLLCQRLFFHRKDVFCHEQLVVKVLISNYTALGFSKIHRVTPEPRKPRE